MLYNIFGGEMVDNRQQIEEIISQSENKQYISDMFSDHFDCLDKPVLVSIGVHLEKNTLEDVVSMLRCDGIEALPYYDLRVKDNLGCFVVDGTGISSPVLEVKDAIKATADVVDILKRNNIKTSLALPICQESMMRAIPRTYNNNIIDIPVNNPAEDGVDEFISRKLNEIDENVKDIAFGGVGSLWRGGTLGDKPYAISHHDRKRDVAYGTNDVATAIGYADGYDGRGLTFKLCNGKSYGFLYEFAEAEKQRYYSMAFIENGGEAEECKNRPENRPDYETPVIPDRNPLKSIYVVVREMPSERPKSKETTIDLTQYKAIKIADGDEYLSGEWKKFAKLHTPYNTNERNDYMLERMNRQVIEFTPMSYHKLNGEENLSYEAIAPSIKGLVFSNDIKELDENSTYKYELKNANFKSFNFPKDCDLVQFSGSFVADNCPVSDAVSCLDLSKCTGIVGISNCDLSNIKEIVLPEKCFCFFLENVKLPKKTTLDFNQIQCEHQRMVFRNCHFSDYTNLNIPADAQFKGETTLPNKFYDVTEALNRVRTKISQKSELLNVPLEDSPKAVQKTTSTESRQISQKNRQSLSNISNFDRVGR